MTPVGQNLYPESISISGIIELSQLQLKNVGLYVDAGLQKLTMKGTYDHNGIYRPYLVLFDFAINHI